MAGQWAVDCPYCQAEWPSLQGALALAGPHPTLVAVDVWKESRSYIAAAVRSEGLPGTILVDPYAKHTPQNVFYGPYQGYVVPTAFYLDARGVVLFQQPGEESYNEFVANMQAVEGTT
jgi:hypothetical protein